MLNEGAQKRRLHKNKMFVIQIKKYIFMLPWCECLLSVGHSERGAWRSLLSRSDDQETWDSGPGSRESWEVNTARFFSLLCPRLPGWPFQVLVLLSYKREGHRYPLWRAMSLLPFSPRNTCPCAQGHTPRMVPAVLFTIVNTWNSLHVHQQGDEK